MFNILYGLKFNLIGQISVSELLLLISAPFIVKNYLEIKTNESKKILRLYLFLFLAQILLELFVGNKIENSLKSLATTLISFLHFAFITIILLKDFNYIKIILIGIILKILIFPTKYVSDISVIELDNATYVKFFLGSLLCFGYLLIINLRKWSKNKIIISASLLGLVLILLSARNLGLTVLIAAIMMLFLKDKDLNTKALTIRLLVVAFSSYLMYYVYVGLVISGSIGSDSNRNQIVKNENPYNPIYLLMNGRAYTFVGMYAFMDKFWTGHGAWAEDKGYKYHFLLKQFNTSKKENIETFRNHIPSHSVIIGMGTRNGILAFSILLLIIGSILKLGFKSIPHTKDASIKYLLYYSIVFIIWNGTFSPMGQLKNSLPLYFAICMTLFLKEKKHLTN